MPRPLIEIVEGDITRQRVDAIVNAANSRLQHGAGVAGAIVAGGGEVIQRESDAIGFVAVGGAAVTSAGELPCRFVIHAVGPRMGEGDEEAKLRQATRLALQRGEELAISSIALPAISTGIFGFPIDRCADIMLREAIEFGENARNVRRIVFCLWGEVALTTFQQTFQRLVNDER
jgi:O-acetyl-ADP-ribose deacetylase (regulator of RNase III)